MLIYTKVSAKAEKRIVIAVPAKSTRQERYLTKEPGLLTQLTGCYCPWIQVRSATPLKIKTVRCAIHKFYSRQEVKNHELHTPH